jgi:hypothetical protein
MFCKHKASVQVRLLPNIFYTKTLQAGFEPTSWWLTATRSTTELLEKFINADNNLLKLFLNLNEMDNLLKDLFVEHCH